MSMRLLEVSDVKKQYGSGCSACIERTGDDAGTNHCPVCDTVIACANINLTVDAGEVLGIVGESGSGKSSLAELIALEKDDEGEVAGDISYTEYDGNLLAVDYQTRHELKNTHLSLVHQHIRDGLMMSVNGSGACLTQLRFLLTGWTTQLTRTPAVCNGVFRSRVHSPINLISLSLTNRQQGLM